jgi:hypothetical protein
MVQILYIISIVCLIALVGAAAAIVHQVRASHRARHPQAPPEPTFAEHLEAAAEYGSPRSPRLVPHQSSQSISAKKDIGPAASLSSTTEESHTRHKSPHIVHRSLETAGISEPAERPDSNPALRIVAGTRTAASNRF